MSEGRSSVNTFSHSSPKVVGIMVNQAVIPPGGGDSNFGNPGLPPPQPTRPLADAERELWLALNPPYRRRHKPMYLKLAHAF